MVQVNKWVLMLIGMVVVPLLKSILPALKVEAAKTETPFDDSLVGAFEVVIEALSTGGFFVEKK